MHRRKVRSARGAARATTGKLLLTSAAIGAAMTLLAASPAGAAGLWTAGPAAGAPAVAYTACAGGQIETTNGNDGPSLSPMYMAPKSAFSGLFAPAGSRHVPVGMPLGSAPPLCVDL